MRAPMAGFTPGRKEPASSRPSRHSRGDGHDARAATQAVEDAHHHGAISQGLAPGQVVAAVQALRAAQRLDGGRGQVVGVHRLAKASALAGQGKDAEAGDQPGHAGDVGVMALRIDQGGTQDGPADPFRLAKGGERGFTLGQAPGDLALLRLG